MEIFTGTYILYSYPAPHSGDCNKAEFTDGRKVTQWKKISYFIKSENLKNKY